MTGVHALLKRQLKRLGLDEADAPEKWRALLETISRTYTEADQDRYTIERSLDISSRELRQLYDVRLAKEAAELATRAKSDFLLNMSHELRTPLNAILGFARVLARETQGVLGGDQSQYLRNIVRAGEHMIQLVNDLLELRGVEEHATAKDTLELGPLLDSGVSLVRPLAADRQLQLSLSLPERLPRVLADRRAVVQIMINLVSNAIKFTPAGGTIAVSAVDEGGWVQVAVVDTGIGIAPEDQARLFTYFEQVGGKYLHHMHGSGVGLALTRALVEKLGGSISVESSPGRGSAFRFRLKAVTSP